MQDSTDIIVSDLTDRLNTASSLDEVELILFETVLLLTGAEQCTFVTLEALPVAGCHVYFPVTNPAPHTLPSACPAADVVRDGQARQLMFKKYGGEQLIQCPFVEQDILSYIGIPVRYEGKLLGVLEAVNLAVPDNIEQQSELMSAIADAAGEALARHL